MDELKVELPRAVLKGTELLFSDAGSGDDFWLKLDSTYPDAPVIGNFDPSASLESIQFESPSTTYDDMIFSARLDQSYYDDGLQAETNQDLKNIEQSLARNFCSTSRFCLPLSASSAVLQTEVTVASLVEPWPNSGATGLGTESNISADRAPTHLGRPLTCFEECMIESGVISDISSELLTRVDQLRRLSPKPGWQSCRFFVSFGYSGRLPHISVTPFDGSEAVMSLAELYQTERMTDFYSTPEFERLMKARHSSVNERSNFKSLAQELEIWENLEEFEALESSLGLSSAGKSSVDDDPTQDTGDLVLRLSRSLYVDVCLNKPDTDDLESVAADLSHMTDALTSVFDSDLEGFLSVLTFRREIEANLCVVFYSISTLTDSIYFPATMLSFKSLLRVLSENYIKCHVASNILALSDSASADVDWHYTCISLNLESSARRALQRIEVLRVAAGDNSLACNWSDVAGYFLTSPATRVPVPVVEKELDQDPHSSGKELELAVALAHSKYRFCMHRLLLLFGFASGLQSEVVLTSPTDFEKSIQEFSEQFPESKESLMSFVVCVQLQNEDRLTHVQGSSTCMHNRDCTHQTVGRILSTRLLQFLPVFSLAGEGETLLSERESSLFSLTSRVSLLISDFSLPPKRSEACLSLSDKRLAVAEVAFAAIDLGSELSNISALQTDLSLLYVLFWNFNALSTEDHEEVQEGLNQLAMSCTAAERLTILKPILTVMSGMSVGPLIVEPTVFDDAAGGVTNLLINQSRRAISVNTGSARRDESQTTYLFDTNVLVNLARKESALTFTMKAATTKGVLMELSKFRSESRGDLYAWVVNFLASIKHLTIFDPMNCKSVDEEIFSLCNDSDDIVLLSSDQQLRNALPRSELDPIGFIKSVSSGNFNSLRCRARLGDFKREDPVSASNFRFVSEISNALTRALGLSFDDDSRTVLDLPEPTPVDPTEWKWIRPAPEELEEIDELEAFVERHRAEEIDHLRKELGSQSENMSDTELRDWSISSKLELYCNSETSMRSLKKAGEADFINVESLLSVGLSKLGPKQKDMTKRVQMSTKDSQLGPLNFRFASVVKDDYSSLMLISEVTDLWKGVAIRFKLERQESRKSEIERLTGSESSETQLERRTFKSSSSILFSSLHIQSRKFESIEYIGDDCDTKFDVSPGWTTQEGFEVDGLTPEVQSIRDLARNVPSLQNDDFKRLGILHQAMIHDAVVSRFKAKAVIANHSNLHNMGYFMLCGKKATRSSDFRSVYYYFWDKKDEGSADRVPGGFRPRYTAEATIRGQRCVLWISRCYTISLNVMIQRSQLHINTRIMSYYCQDIDTMNIFYWMWFFIRKAGKKMFSMSKFYNIAALATYNKSDGLVKKYLGVVCTRDVELLMLRKVVTAYNNNVMISRESEESEIDQPVYPWNWTGEHQTAESYFESGNAYVFSPEVLTSQFHNYVGAYRDICDNIGKEESVIAEKRFWLNSNPQKKSASTLFMDMALDEFCKTYSHPSRAEIGQVMNEQFRSFFETSTATINPYTLKKEKGRVVHYKMVSKFSSLDENKGKPFDVSEYLDWCRSENNRLGSYCTVSIKPQKDAGDREIYIQPYHGKAQFFKTQCIFRAFCQKIQDELVSASESEKLRKISEMIFKGRCGFVNIDMAKWSPQDLAIKFRVLAVLLKNKGLVDQDVYEDLVSHLNSVANITVLFDSRLSFIPGLKWVSQSSITSGALRTVVPTEFSDPEKIKRLRLMHPVPLTFGWPQGFFHFPSSFVHILKALGLRKLFCDKMNSLGIPAIVQFKEHSDDGNESFVLDFHDSKMRAEKHEPSSSGPETNALSDDEISQMFMKISNYCAGNVSLATSDTKISMSSSVSAFTLDNERSRWSELVSIYNRGSSVISSAMRQLAGIFPSLSHASYMSNHITILTRCTQALSCTNMAMFCEFAYSVCVEALKLYYGIDAQMKVYNKIIQYCGDKAVSLRMISKFGISSDNLVKFMQFPAIVKPQLKDPVSEWANEIDSKKAGEFEAEFGMMKAIWSDSSEFNMAKALASSILNQKKGAFLADRSLAIFNFYSKRSKKVLTRFSERRSVMSDEDMKKTSSQVRNEPLVANDYDIDFDETVGYSTQFLSEVVDDLAECAEASWKQSDLSGKVEVNRLAVAGFGGCDFADALMYLKSPDDFKSNPLMNRRELDVHHSIMEFAVLTGRTSIRDICTSSMLWDDMKRLGMARSNIQMNCFSSKDTGDLTFSRTEQLPEWIQKVIDGGTRFVNRFRRIVGLIKSEDYRLYCFKVILELGKLASKARNDMGEASLAGSNGKALSRIDLSVLKKIVSGGPSSDSSFEKLLDMVRDDRLRSLFSLICGFSVSQRKFGMELVDSTEQGSNIFVVTFRADDKSITKAIAEEVSEQWYTRADAILPLKRLTKSNVRQMSEDRSHQLEATHRHSLEVRDIQTNSAYLRIEAQGSNSGAAWVDYEQTDLLTGEKLIRSSPLDVKLNRLARPLASLVRAWLPHIERKSGGLTIVPAEKQGTFSSFDRFSTDIEKRLSASISKAREMNIEFMRELISDHKRNQSELFSSAPPTPAVVRLLSGMSAAEKATPSKVQDIVSNMVQSEVFLTTTCTVGNCSQSLGVPTDSLIICSKHGANKFLRARLRRLDQNTSAESQSWTDAIGAAIKGGRLTRREITLASNQCKLSSLCHSISLHEIDLASTVNISVDTVPDKKMIEHLRALKNSGCETVILGCDSDSGLITVEDGEKIWVSDETSYRRGTSVSRVLSAQSWENHLKFLHQYGFEEQVYPEFMRPAFWATGEPVLISDREAKEIMIDINNMRGDNLNKSMSRVWPRVEEIQSLSSESGTVSFVQKNLLQVVLQENPGLATSYNLHRSMSALLKKKVENKHWLKYCSVSRTVTFSEYVVSKMHLYEFTSNKDPEPLRPPDEDSTTAEDLVKILVAGKRDYREAIQRLRNTHVSDFEVLGLDPTEFGVRPPSDDGQSVDLGFFGDDDPYGTAGTNWADDADEQLPILAGDNSSQSKDILKILRLHHPLAYKKTFKVDHVLSVLMELSDQTISLNDDYLLLLRFFSKKTEESFSAIPLIFFIDSDANLYHYFPELSPESKSLETGGSEKDKVQRYAERWQVDKKPIWDLIGDNLSFVTPERSDQKKVSKSILPTGGLSGSNFSVFLDSLIPYCRVNLKDKGQLRILARSKNLILEMSEEVILSNMRCIAILNTYLLARSLGDAFPDLSDVDRGHDVHDLTQAARLIEQVMV